MVHHMDGTTLFICPKKIATIQQKT
jgi:hypothetical protein